MTASQSQRKIYNPGETEHEVRDHDGGYGEMPVDGPHHNRGDLERSDEPGYRESHQPGVLPRDEAVSPDGAQELKNIKSQETVKHTSEQRGGEDQQAPADISGAPMKTAQAVVFPSAARVARGEESPARRVGDAAPPSPALPMTDADILAAVIQRLKHSESLDISEVRIAVEHANVILEGFVPHRFMQHAIEDVVDRCAGVHEIDNRIHVRHRPGEDEPTLSIGT
jgi:osmotically-inducible protein OsmY